MRIQSGTVQMKSARNYAAISKTASKTSTQSIMLSTTNRQLFSNTNLGFNNTKGSFADAKSQFLHTPVIRNIQNADEVKSLAKIQEETLDYLMQLFFGKGIKLATNNPSLSPFRSAQGLMTQTVETMTSYEETEQTAFSTNGTVITADGRKLSFSVDVAMSRSFSEVTYSKTQMLATTEFCDPLVINLNTNIAEVSSQKFYFDLDADGHEEAISMLSGSSGFLALDKNGDGKINDGSELFGAKSGDGFADLAKYDSDGNGWIDEADEIFDKLLIWTKDRSGKDVLCGLGKAGIGAIYLKNASTEFSLNDRQDNTVNARIRKTGIFLYENGMAGTIQHVDFAK